jgi:hypothetical protein
MGEVETWEVWRSMTLESKVEDPHVIPTSECRRTSWQLPRSRERLPEGSSARLTLGDATRRGRVQCQVRFQFEVYT